MKDNVLHNALRLAKKGKYGEVITLLEREVYRYRESYRYYYILALAGLKQGDFGRAFSYFKCAHDLKNHDTNVLLGIAVINVKRGESARALDLYLKILDIEPDNKKAKAALAVLRQYGGREELADWVASGKILKLYPAFPKSNAPPPLALIGGLIALGILLAGLAAAFYLRLLPLSGKETRAGFTVTALSADDRTALFETGGVYHTILTEKQLLSAYDSARAYFNNYKDNSARVMINKIILSNAGAGIKNKARLLLEYMSEPGFDTLTERFSYREVAKEPALYDGCYVIWGGRAANVSMEDKETSFDFLIGYETRRELLGTVRVHYPSAFYVDTERPLEVLGRIVVQPDNSFSLEGISVHQP